MQLTAEQRKRDTSSITLWGVVINLILSAIKITGGIFGHSQALFADGLHSLSDLVSDAMVLFAAKHASVDADEDHPYGHARYETLATVGLGLLLIGVAAGIGLEAISRLNQEVIPQRPQLYTLFIAALSIISKEVLYHATMRVSLRIKSRMLEANAWHHRSDAISSVIVFIGIGGTYYGYPLLDIIAALLVAVMIVKIGIDLTRQGVQELVDTALEPEIIEQIKRTILSVEDVKQLHLLRSRRMGQHALVDVHIQVSPKLSVSEGHHISEMVEKRIKQAFEEINDVTVHIDPEDDEKAASCSNLPLRKELVEALFSEWQDSGTLSPIRDITLHYLSGHIDIEATYPIERLKTLEESGMIRRAYEESCHTLPCVGKCYLNFR